MGRCRTYGEQALLLCCFLILQAHVSRSSDDSGSATNEDFCCFKPEDVKLVPLDSTPEWADHYVLQVDNFLCPDALDHVMKAVVRADWYDASMESAFPGMAVAIDQLHKNAPKASKPVIKKFHRMEHRTCLRKSLEMLREDGRLPALVDLSWRSKVWSDMEKRGKELSDAFKAVNKVKGILNPKQKATLQAAEDEGFFNISLTSLQGMAHVIFDDNARDEESVRISYVNKAQPITPYHVDPGAGFVFNLHATPGWEDSATNFILDIPDQNNSDNKKKKKKKKKKQRFPCFASVPRMRPCFRSLHPESAAFGSPGLPVSGHPTPETSGLPYRAASFPQRRNRAYVFSAHIPHAAVFTEEAGKRAMSFGMGGFTVESPPRVVVQNFFHNPLYEMGARVWNFLDDEKNRPNMFPQQEL